MILHEERGFTIGALKRARRSGSTGEWIPLGTFDIRGHETLDGLTRDVLTTVLPDDAEETGEEHPWAWLAELARARGLDVTADDLRGLPYEVAFTDEVQRWVVTG